MRVAQKLNRRNVGMAAAALLPWLGLSWALIFASDSLALPRLGVAPDRPPWEVTARWLAGVLGVGVVLGAVWSTVVEAIALRRGLGSAAVRWVARGGLALCVAMAGYLGERSGEEGFAIGSAFGFPLFFASRYFLRGASLIWGGGPLPLLALGAAYLGLCGAFWPSVLLGATLVALLGAFVVYVVLGVRRAGSL